MADKSVILEAALAAAMRQAARFDRPLHPRLD
jgi:hypothetical protein